MQNLYIINNKKFLAQFPFFGFSFFFFNETFFSNFVTEIISENCAIWYSLTRKIVGFLNEISEFLNNFLV